MVAPRSAPADWPDDTPPGGPAELRFATGKLGCLLPLIGASTLFFAYAAVVPGGLEEDGRARLYIAIANAVRLGDVGILYLAAAAGLLWAFVRFGWRWADGVAVRATQAGLEFHPTLMRRRVSWREVRDVGLRTRRTGWRDVRELVLVLADRRVRVHGFEDEDAEAFMAAVRAELRRR